MSTDTRIATLESQVRTLKRMLFGVFGVVVVGGLLAATSLQSVPDVIQAKKFEVVDQHGQSKAVFGLGPFKSVKANEPYIVFKNKDGEALAGLGVLSGGGALVLGRSDGSNYAAIVHADEGGAFALINKHGNKTAVLVDGVSYGGVLELSRPDGSTYTGIAQTDEKAVIEISDKKGNAKVFLAMKGEQPIIGCLDSKGDIAVEITVSKSGPSVSCMGPGGSLMKGGAEFFGGSTYFGGGAITLWNMDGVMKILGPPPGLTEEDKKLLEACAKGGASVSAIQALVQSGADVNRPWFNPADYAMGHDTNLTALMLAAKNQSNPAVLSALLNAGADANATSSQGNKAIEFARLNKKLKGTNAIQELEAAMKKD